MQMFGQSTNQNHYTVFRVETSLDTLLAQVVDSDIHSMSVRPEWTAKI